jgi:hypothetical protein
MSIYSFRAFQSNLKTTGFIHVVAISALFFSGQSSQAMADESMSEKRDCVALIGRTTLQDLLMKHPNASQVVKLPNGTSIIYAYKNNFNALPSNTHADIRGANAIELNFDKNQILSTINLINFNESK